MSKYSNIPSVVRKRLRERYERRNDLPAAGGAALGSAVIDRWMVTTTEKEGILSIQDRCATGGNDKRTRVAFPKVYKGPVEPDFCLTFTLGIFHGYDRDVRADTLEPRVFL